MKNTITQGRFSKALRFTIFQFVALAVLCAGNAPLARAESAFPQTRQIVVVPGTVAITRAMENAVVRALQADGGIPAGARYFAITDVRSQGPWSVVSIAGLARVHDGQTWSLQDDAAWTGLVLLKRGADSKWLGGTQGTRSFASLIDSAPNTFLSPKAKRDLVSAQQPSAEALNDAAAYTFPWQAGTAMMYGTLGVHANGFSSVVDGWKAVDMMSDGNTAAGHAPNRLLAAEAGTISYKCKDGNNIAIHLGDFFYTHLALANDAALSVGASFAQAAYLGPLRKGNFTGPCGWANQPADWFHVHWGFPNANLQVENWVLNISTQNWTNGTTIVKPGNGWIYAGGMIPCAAPTLSAPLAGAVSASQTISFSWAPLTACAFNGYMFRIKTVPTMDSDGITIADATSSQASRTQTISSDWNKQDLYWGVKAANAPFGASWSVGHFQIDPGGAVPTDYGYCADDGQRCAFSGPALMYYGANDQFIGPLSFTDGADCNSTVFGDPIPDTAKKCYIRGGRPEGSYWCTNQGGTCSVGSGNLATVYYGVNGQYFSRVNVVDSIACNNTAFGGDPFPSLAKACYYIVTGQVTPATKTFISNAAQDGWILESSQSSSTGGAMDSVGITFRLGDDIGNRQYRTILSFPTAGLPDNATVTSATLKIMSAAVTGGNPFDSLGSIYGDIQRGAFSGSAVLQLGDWQATASQKKVFVISNNPAGSWYSNSLGSSSLGYINLVGPTQVRLRFSTPDNGNSANDYMEFYSSNYAANPAYRPRLIIGYYVPN